MGLDIHGNPDNRDIHGNPSNRDIHGNPMDRDIHGNSESITRDQSFGDLNTNFSSGSDNGGTFSTSTKERTYSTFDFDDFKGLLIPVLIPLLTLAVLLFGLGLEVYEKISSSIAEGRSQIWVSRGVFLFFVVVQIYAIVSFFRNIGVTRKNRIVTSSAIGIFVLLLVYCFVLNYLAHSGSPETQAWVAKTDLTTNVSGVFSFVWMIIVVFFFSAVGAGLIYSFLFLGPTMLGASLAIAVHNLANGVGFNIAVLPSGLSEALFNFPLSEPVAWPVMIGWFFLSWILLK